jgi:hypothetical protein
MSEYARASRNHGGDAREAYAREALADADRQRSAAAQAERQRCVAAQQEAMAREARETRARARKSRKAMLDAQYRKATLDAYDAKLASWHQGYCQTHAYRSEHIRRTRIEARCAHSVRRGIDRDEQRMRFLCP